MTLQSINPANKELIAKFEELTPEQVSEKINLASEQYREWSTLPLGERIKKLRKLAEILRQNKQKYSHIITSEVGKTLAASEAEVEKSASALDFYCDNATSLLAPKEIASDASKSYINYEPIGVILAVMPWNFPFWQVFRFLAPALTAGNVGLLKHASNVQLSAKAIEEAVLQAGIPEGVFQNLEISSRQVESVINNPVIRAVTLTGSEYAGSQVAMHAGRNIKKTVLELGGSDPFIVLNDANIDEAVNSAVLARLQANAGQSCIAAKRFLVQSDISQQFTDKLAAAVSQLKVGDPLDPSTDVGPMVNRQGLEDITRQLRESVDQGATILTGGEVEDSQGLFFKPAVISNISTDMPAFREELFGPVFPIISFDSLDEAVELANNSMYGLGATIFSQNIEKAESLASRIESGQVFINHQVKSDPRLPFGGIKNSGYGRELSSHGMYEFLNIKTIWIK